MRQRNVRAQTFRPGTSLTVYIGLRELCSAQAPFTYRRKRRVRRPSKLETAEGIDGIGT
jgi:hypothetical protein